MEENPIGRGRIAVELVDLGIIGQLHDDVGGDRAITADLVRSYADRAPDLVAALQRAASGHESEQIRRIAHDLRSMSAFVGAEGMVILAAELEDGSWTPERSVEVAAQMASLVSEVVDELRRFVERL